MMSITRTGSLIEVSLASSRLMSIEVAEIRSMALIIEKLPCGRIVQGLLLSGATGTEPLRIDGTTDELAVVREYVVESLMEAHSANAVRMH